MDIQVLIPSLGIFLTVICAAFGLMFIMKEQANKRVRDRLNDVILLSEEQGAAKAVILRDMDLSTVPFLNKFLANAGWARRLDTLLVQGDISMRLGSFIALMLFLGSLGSLVATSILHQPLLALPAAIVPGSIPLLYARNRKHKRVRKFEEQFPDALDMLTGALRAGMALTGAIQVVADEAPDPVSKEFTILFEENRLGLDMKEAMKKLAGRVDSNELRLFVTAVILQRETGGNLAEILEGTAAVIRDRFRILGDVRSLTAQGRLSGLVMTLLPVGMACIIMFIAPDYLKGLITDPLGKYMIVAAVLLQILGFGLMRRIVNIRV